MIITKEWLAKKRACRDGVDWFLGQHEEEGLKVLNALIADNKLDWANWLIVRLMKYKQYVSYAVFAAEQAINLYEERYPYDKRLRRAIETARKCIDNPSDENKSTAYISSIRTGFAHNATSHAAVAAALANPIYTAFAASYASAFTATYSTIYSTTSATFTAFTKKQIQLKILKYGIKLLKKI